MKKTIFNSKWILPVILIAMTVSSCLKDNDYDDGLYGSVRDTEGQQFVSIPKAAKTSGNVIAITAKNEVQNLNLFEVNYDFVSSTVSDITVTIAVDNSNVTKVNPSALPLPTSAYTIPSLTMVIPKGSNLSDAFKFNFLTTPLDPTKIYGIGFSITAISPAGISIPKNLKNVIYYFTLKNKYDGIYRLQGYHNRVPYTFPYDVKIHMITASANSVIFYWPEVSSVGHPIGTGPGATNWYGPAIAPVVVFNPATDLVTDVYNDPPNTTPITMFTGTGSRISKYNSATKAITVDWHYNNNPLRAFFDDLTYIGPRP